MTQRRSRWRSPFTRKRAPLLAILTSIFVVPQSAALEQDYERLGRLVDIGTTRLHLHCEGDGAPTVIVDTGLGEPALEWVPVQERLRHYARTCLYDRAGYGWSEVGELPRSSSRIANELYLLLQRSGLSGPYVMVGHSYGGLNMQLFARRYPYLIAGLVLVDSSHAEQIARMHVPMLKKLDAIRATYQGGVATTDFIARPLPPVDPGDGTAEIGMLMMSRADSMRTVASEYLNFKASARQLQRNAGRLPDVPLAVLSRGRGASGNEWDAGNEQAWRALQKELAEAVPRAAHIVAAHSGHSIHREQPALVADAIAMVIDFARAEGGGAAHRSKSAAGGATTWLAFADGIWMSDHLHTSTDVCPFGCEDRQLARAIRRSGHLAGTGRPAWQRIIYGQ